MGLKGSSEKPIKVGVSACLLGQKVRFDAGHKQDRYITDILGQYFQFVPVCPEVEVGMGVPRESVRLVGASDAPRMVGTKTGADWTGRMRAYAEKRVRRRDMLGLCGYILKKDSPSCGMERVKRYQESGLAVRSAVGLYAQILMERYPLLPVEEEGRLNDARIRDNFVERVFAYYRLQRLFASGLSRGGLVEFHGAHKYLLLAHSPKHYTLLGRLVADIKKQARSEFREKYSALFMEALAVTATPKKHHNVMLHILGFLKTVLDPADKKYLLGVLDDYRNGLVPLVVPLTLLRQYVARHEVKYITDQIYLNPHPQELMLRNHV